MTLHYCGSEISVSAAYATIHEKHNNEKNYQFV